MEPKWKQHTDQFRSQIKDDIFDVTMKLILERGINGVTIVDITKKVGISRVTFYKHYNSIHEIAFDIQFKIMSDIVDHLEAETAKGENGAEQLLNFCHYFIDLFKTNIGNMRFIAIFDHTYGTAFPSPELQEKYRELILNFRKPIKEIVQTGIQDGSLREDPNPDLLALTIVHSLWGLIQRLATRKNLFVENSLEEDISVLDNFVSLLMRSLIVPN
ncbi:TetR/AcrR family transcriptional regulator [Mesobacillus foraminis]|uniref:TetR/AcrR family transcriptional regulator n=1 Tax=Mesobacillus foraminis TaxID=279826 RepID=UPI000EF47A17|nr:TetR/AcrR family transcriptional regulator [Mesobacillus foraminis]